MRRVGRGLQPGRHDARILERVRRCPDLGSRHRRSPRDRAAGGREITHRRGVPPASPCGSVSRCLTTVAVPVCSRKCAPRSFRNGGWHGRSSPQSVTLPQHVGLDRWEAGLSNDAVYGVEGMGSCSLSGWITETHARRLFARRGPLERQPTAISVSAHLAVERRLASGASCAAGSGASTSRHPSGRTSFLRATRSVVDTPPDQRTCSGPGSLRASSQPQKRTEASRYALSPAGLVGARGFEPLASSASRKRSTPELSARSPAWYRRAEAGTGIEPVYRVLQTLA